jgi:hypothetical protein
MASRPIPLNSIDETFAKILIEELAQRDQIADLGGDALHDMTDTASQRWETIAALEVSADENGGQMSNGQARPTIRPVAPPIPLEPASIPLEPSPSAARTQLWQFCITYPDGRQCTMPLEDKPITIGREKDNAIVLKCEKVSRHHARILVDDRGPRVDDLGSVNGVLVNGIKVPAAYLKSGDIVRIGTVKIQLILAE